MAKLYFIYGAMNCGKSTSLLQVAHNYEERGMHVTITKLVTDTRGSTNVVSRLGVVRKADVLMGPQDDTYGLMRRALPESSCVLMDEAQFMSPRQAERLHQAVHELHIPCMCYGLKIDFAGRGFPDASRLLELADEIREMRTICRCGRKATMNLRLVRGRATFDDRQVEVDDQSDIRYVSVCADCFYQIRAGRMAYGA